MRSIILHFFTVLLLLGPAGCGGNDGGGSAPPSPPSVSSASITIDDSGCSGPPCRIGDALLFRWDNSASGDNNADVTSVSQVQFDLGSFGLGVVNPALVVAGVFTYTWIVPSGGVDSTGLSFSVTAVDSEGASTGPVVSIDTVDLDNQQPLITTANVTIDDSACTGPGASCIIGDTISFLWDNSSSGDNNADITSVSQVSFDLTNVGFGSSTVPNGVTAGIFRCQRTVVAGSINSSGLSIAVSAADDAGNVSGPVVSIDTVTINNVP